MFENSGFGRSIELLQRSMDVSSLRHSVIANNIANADVPNFKRSDINFESFLKRAIDSEDSRPVLELKRSRERHLSNYQPVDWKTVEPRRVLDYLSTEKNNGNNVNAEEEFMASLQNQLRYTLMTQAAAYEFNQVSQVLRQ
ncbi:MAG TPA: flagellar basal body rod protein FlgB [Spirochaetales bacterium]|nr:flagellar basal body rod protein FlgB [Spirochaetales bacterium]MBP7262703.1 flagellar basal body rod protein FlgB [Spirochaetia bacterium]HPE35541.1 flagellar basal body rod protein FlgB [Spirochaetales bacterium]